MNSLEQEKSVRTIFPKNYVPNINLFNPEQITYKNILEEAESDIVLSQFNWTGIPTTLVLDRNLSILHTLNGEITANEIIELTK